MARSGLLNAIHLKLSRILWRRAKFILPLILCTLLFMFLMTTQQDGAVTRSYFDEETTLMEMNALMKAGSGRSRYGIPTEPAAAGKGDEERGRQQTQVVLSRKMKSSLQNAVKPNPERKLMELNDTQIEVVSRHPSSRWSSYKEALEACAENGTRKLIILSLVDEGFVQMALNFYQVSLARHGLDMMLFIGLTYNTCESLEHHGLPCYVYRETASGRHASLFHSTFFLQKMNIRTDMVLEALKHGYTVLHTDLDLIYFENPLNYIPCNGICDLAALIDKDDYNAGFIFLRPTNNSIWIYQRMQELAAASPLLDDQDQLTQAIVEMENDCINFNVVRLDRVQFQNGLQYFELSDRTFEGEEITPCLQCIVIHNNWIVSVEAKTYRFKELHQWFYDGPDRYYTATDRKYLSYSNPLRLEDPGETDRLETLALVNALAICQILNRTLVLPKFHCYEKDSYSRFCALNSKFNVASFDSQFAGSYREHSFLGHPLVPERFKAYPRKVYVIVSNVTEVYMPHVIKDVTVTPLVPRNPARGATPSEILHWFVMIDDPVLAFHSLYGAFSEFDRVSVRNEFSSRIESGLKTSKYRQL